MSEERLRVLLLDDEESLRVPLKKFLEDNFGYHVDAVPDGKEALWLVEETQGRYDVALIDELLMPGPSGLHVMKQIKARHPDIEVILFTGWGLDSALEALRAGAYRYLAKPFNVEELGMLIRAAAEQGQTRRERKILSALQKVSAAINSALDLNEILRQTCQAVVELFGVDHSGVVMFDTDLSQGRVIAEYPDRETLGIQRTFGTVIPVHGVPAEERLVYQKEVLNIPDVANEESLGPVREVLLNFGIRSILIVPIVVKDQVIASFSLNATRETRTFSASEVELCKSLANQVAVAIENVRLLQETQQRADQLDALRHTTLAVTSQLDRKTLLTTIIQQAVALLRAKSGGIYEYYPERGELTIVADHGRPRNVLGNTLKLGEGMAGRLVLSGDPHMIVNDYNTWPGRAAIYADGRPFEAVLEVPLKWQERIIGVLYVDDKVGRKFTSEDARLLGLFADQAAIALVNAELITKDVEKLKRLERLSQAIREIMGDLGTMPLDNRLTLIAKRATEILEAETCGVHLVKREGYLSLEASYGHREGGFQKGKQFAIRSGPKGGLTGHIAFEGKLFNSHGDALINHFAVRNEEPDHSPSGQCYSLLAIPLKKKIGQEEKLVGLLRAANKKDKDGRALPTLRFTQEDEWILNIFAEAVVVAIESAEWVEQLGEQKDHLARLVASSPDGIIAIDTQETVTGFNEQAQEILGYTADEVMRTPVARLYDDPREPRKIGKQLHLTADGKLANYETFVKSKDGDRIPIRLSATWLYDAKKKRVGSVGYFEDLRSIKETERRLELILKASNTLAEAENLTEGLQSLAEMIVSLLSHTFCRILLLDESRQFLVVKAAYPITRSAGKLNWESGLEKRTAVSDWPGLHSLLSAGNPRVLRWNGERARPILERLSLWLNLEKVIQSLLMVPLKRRNDIVGLLEVGELRGEERRRFTDTEIELASAIAAQTAILIDRMRLHEITERRKVELEHLRDAIEKMASAAGTLEVLQRIVTSAKEVLEADCTLIWPYDEARDRFFPEELVAEGIPPEMLAKFKEDEPNPGSTTRRVLKEGYVAVTDLNAQEDEFIGSRTRESLKALGVVSFEGIRLEMGTDKLGVLFVDYKHQHTFASKAKQMLKNFGNHAALALKKARLFDQIMRAREAARAVAKLSAIGELKKTMKSIVQSAQEVLHCDVVTLYTFDEERWQFTDVEAIGFHNWANIHPPEKVTGESVLWKVINLEEPFYLAADDAPSHELLKGHFVHGEGIKSSLAILLRAAGKRVGAMFINYRTPHRFKKDDLDDARLFADQAAVAIRNAQLFGQVQGKVNALQTLYEAGRAITGSLELGDILNRIAEQAWNLAGQGGYTSIRLVEDMKARVVASYPREELDKTRAVLGEEIDLRIGISGRIGVIGRTILTGESQLVGDVASDPDYLESHRGTCSELAAPIKVVGQVIGVINVEHPDLNAFDEEDRRTLESLAAQAAVAIRNAQLHGETKKRADTLHTLYQAGKTITGSLTLEETLNRITEQALRIVGGCSSQESCFSHVALLEGNKLCFVAASTPEILAGLQQKVGEIDLDASQRIGISGRAAKTGQWQNEGDVSKVPDYIPFGPHINSQLSVPIKIGDQVIGVVSIEHPALNACSPEDQRNVELLAAQAAVAIENARLFSAAEQRAHNLDAVLRVSQTVISSLDLDHILTAACQAAVDLLGVDHSGLVLFDQDLAKGIVRAEYPEMGARGLVIPLRGVPAEERLIESKRPLTVTDVASEPAFDPVRDILLKLGTRSILIVPVVSKDQLLGSFGLDVMEHQRVFTEEETELCEVFAAQVAVAIENARAYEDLKKIKGLVGSKTATDWMRMVSTAWGHAVRREASVASNYLALIQQDLMNKDRLQVQEDLLRLTAVINRIKDIPIIAPLVAEDTIIPLLVNDLLRQHLERVWQREPYKSVPLVCDLQYDLDEMASTRASPEWIRRVIEILVDNAVQAMLEAESSARELVVATRISGAAIEIFIKDNGPGIPPEILHQIFISPIDKPPGSRGAGLGLVLAKNIAQTYGGDLRIKHTGRNGTTMVLSLPIEQ